MSDQPPHSILVVAAIDIAKRQALTQHESPYAPSA
jgi:hypothetical protein